MKVDYDIISVGGGLAGSSIAKAMAERGYKVLVLERETKFRDRVRGENILSWGVAEAKELGLYDLLMEAGGHHPLIQENGFEGNVTEQRDLSSSTPNGCHALCMPHQVKQEVVLKAAADAGAEVRRGVLVKGVSQGEVPTVTVKGEGGEETLSARLVVGADGRGSRVREWVGFETLTHELDVQLSGVLFHIPEGVDRDKAINMFDTTHQTMALFLPQAEGRVRAYFGNRIDSGLRLMGDNDIPRFIEESIKTGIPQSAFEGAKQIGPLASYPCIFQWVDHPYKDNVVLIGDSGTTSDQTWGQGVSLAFGAARRLRDALLETDDWIEAGHAFAEASKKMWDPIRLAELWNTELLFDKGKEADEIRARAFAGFAEDPTRLPDVFFSGPDCVPINEEARIRMMGEDLVAAQ